MSETQTQRCMQILVLVLILTFTVEGEKSSVTQSLYIKTTSLSHKRLRTPQHSQCSVLAQIMRLVKVTERLVFYSQTAEVQVLTCKC